MALSVYTHLLGSNPALPFGATTLGTVPSGFVWVVRDVTFFNSRGSAYGFAGVRLIDGTGACIAGVGPDQARGGVPIQVETRQLLVAGDILQAIALETGWSVRVTGYQLTLP